MFNKETSEAKKKADKHIDAAFSVLNQLAYGEDSPLDNDQRILIDRAMKQLSHASLNVIQAL